MRKLVALGLRMVTFITTAVASSGTPPFPVTCSSRDSRCPTGFDVGNRVSRMRAGTNGS